MRSVILLAILLAPSIAGASSINMDNLSAAVNSTVVYPLVIQDAKDIGAVQLKMTFDPKVIRINSASSSDFPNFISNTDTSHLGYISLGAFDTSEKGRSDNIRLADIMIQVTGKERESTPIKMEFSAWDARGAKITGYVVNSGSLSIIKKTGGGGPEPVVITPTVTLALPGETQEKRNEPAATGTAAGTAAASATGTSAGGKEPPAAKGIPGFWALEAALVFAYALKTFNLRNKSIKLI